MNKKLAKELAKQMYPTVCRTAYGQSFSMQDIAVQTFGPYHERESIWINSPEWYGDVEIGFLDLTCSVRRALDGIIRNSRYYFCDYSSTAGMKRGMDAGQILRNYPQLQEEFSQIAPAEFEYPDCTIDGGAISAKYIKDHSTHRYLLTLPSGAKMTFGLNYWQVISFWSLGGIVRWANKKYERFCTIDKPTRIRKSFNEGILRKYGDKCISCREETRFTDECVIENISKRTAKLYLVIRDNYRD